MVFLCIVFEIFRGFTKTSCSDEIYFISYVCWSCFIVGEDDSGRRGSVRGRQCHHHALRYTIMTMNTNACRNVHNYVTYIKYINRAIMICLCAQRIVNTDHKTHNKIASNSIDFGLKMHFSICKPPETLTQVRYCKLLRFYHLLVHEVWAWKHHHQHAVLLLHPRVCGLPCLLESCPAFSRAWEPLLRVAPLESPPA